MKKLKKKLKQILILLKLKKKVIKQFDSKNYWEKRYINKGNSGTGSYGRLAKFKADIINDFVYSEGINKIIELGSGDGNQLCLAKYNDYIGLDVSEKAIKLCKSLFKDDSTKSFFRYEDLIKYNFEAELTLSLDVIFHLVEDEVFEEYMNNLFTLSTKYVIIYSSNYDKLIAQHVRCRKFSSWIDMNMNKNWKLQKIIKNKFPFDENNQDDTSFSDFYIYKKTLDL